MYSISVVIPTFNSKRLLADCLGSIRKQDYAQEKVEIIIVDGGSTDSTIDIAKKFKSEVISEPGEQNNPERRKALGALSAKNDIIAFIDSDNILPHPDWLNKMCAPFYRNDLIIGVSPLRYHYDKKDSLLNRYFSLFGANDPVAYYFNKRDRLSWAEDRWSLLGEAKDRGDFYKVVFKEGEVPTVGANGFLIRKEILLKALKSADDFLHIDINCDLIQMGYNTYAFVKEDIIHLTGSRLWMFLKKRHIYMTQYYLNGLQGRRFKMYSERDRLNLIKYILFSLTLIVPVWHAFKGYAKIHDRAWFLHPVMCLFFLCIYASAVLEWHINRFLEK
jgi:glycosyltransferase involved in cell wall biosynthesis